MGALTWVQLALRVWEFVFSILVMALIGNMINAAFAGNPATVNYAMFVAAFSILSLFYLFPATINLDWAGHAFIVVALDILNAIWFLTAGIALAARLHARDCNNFAYTHMNEITNGEHDTEKRCREAQASVAFLWFAWAGYTASLILSFILARRHTATYRARTGPQRGPKPMMTSV